MNRRLPKTRRELSQSHLSCKQTSNTPASTSPKNPQTVLRITLQSLIYARRSPVSIEPEGLLLFSQEPATGRYPEPHESNPYHTLYASDFYSGGTRLECHLGY
jgi:hypothetical protein